LTYYINREPSLSYDDLLIVPQLPDPSDELIYTRTTLDTSSYFFGHRLELPIVNAPMDTIASHYMLLALTQSGVMGCSHRFQDSLSQTLDLYTTLKSLTTTTGPVPPIVATIGADEKDYINRIDVITQALEGVTTDIPKIWLVDIANGYSPVIERPIQYLRNRFGSSIRIIAGNICTIAGFQYLADLGVDAVRCGIGSGSVCSTRRHTGVGYGQATVISDIAQARSMLNLDHVKIIADGGIGRGADFCKALALGADLVMIGRMFAGTNECPKQHKNTYRGMASKEVMEDHGITGKMAEGVEVKVKSQGGAWKVLDYLGQSLRSSMSYVNAHNLEEYRDRAILRRVTNNTYIEGLTKGDKE